MGVDQRAVEVLERLRVCKELEGRILTLGRQHIDYEDRVFAGLEWLDEWLDSESMDVSLYEGATHVHDLQEPIPEELVGKYDLILDFGTTEHIYDISSVYDGIYELLKPGGLYVGLNGRTGWASHGLYQFTPEFAFTLSKKYAYNFQCFSVEYGVTDPTWFEYTEYGHDPQETWESLSRMTYLATFFRKVEPHSPNTSAKSVRYHEHLHKTGEAPIAKVVSHTVEDFLRLKLP